jgi:glucokinase
LRRLVVADLNQQIIARKVIPSGGLTVERLASELASLRDDAKALAACVGLAGVISGDERTISVAPNLPSLEGVPLKPLLQERLGVPVAVENDVNLAALGEHASGAGAGTDSMVLVSLGTGLGAGIIIDGKLIRGARDGASEIGFLSSVEDVARRPTDVGSLEAKVSGAALERYGNPREIFERARAGEEAARRIVGSVADELGVAVANLFAMLDPQQVVLGGWITREQDLLFDHVCRVAAQLAPGSAPVLLAELGDDAALLGAASVAHQLANGALGSSGKGTLPAGPSSASDDKP